MFSVKNITLYIISLHPPICQHGQVSLLFLANYFIFIVFSGLLRQHVEQCSNVMQFVYVYALSSVTPSILVYSGQEHISAPNGTFHGTNF